MGNRPTSVPARSMLKRYSLTEESCDVQISDKHLGDISRSNCRKWRELPSRLEMDAIVVGDIGRKPVDEDEKRATFFAKWKEAKGSDATYKALISALLEIGCTEDAECVCKLLKPDPLSTQPAPREFTQPSFNGMSSSRSVILWVL